MADTTVKLTIPYYPDPTAGRPLTSASIYVGNVDTDPEIAGNQKTLSVLEEDGSETVIAQPATTNAGGQVVYNGSPVTLLCSGAYSLKVLNSAGTQQYYIPNCPADVRPDTLAPDDLTVVANNVILGNDNGAGSACQELTASEAKAILSIVPADTTITANNVLLGNDNGASQAAQELTASEAKTLLAIVAADVSDFDTEVANNTTVAANTTHKTSNGSDHTYIDQSVVSGASPTFNAANITGSPTFTTLGATTGNITTVNSTTVNSTTFDTNVAAAGVTLAGTTLAADGTDATIDVTITPKGNAGVVLPNAAGAPAVTTNKLYQTGGVLYFDGISLEGGGGTISDVAYTRAGWNGDTTNGASKNALSDAFFNMVRWQDADTGGTDCTFVGDTANTTNSGDYNTFGGKYSGLVNTTGSQNCFYGYGTGFDNTTASSCCFYGFQSGNNNTDGSRNNAFGDNTLRTLGTTGEDNCAFGFNSLYALNHANADKNCAFGNYSLDALTSGYEWTAVGYNAATAATTGFGGISIGSESAASVTTADDTISIGRGISAANTDNSLAIGRDSDGNAFITGTMTGSTGSFFVRGVPQFTNIMSAGLTPTINNSLVIEFTNATTVTFKGKDGGGTTRTATLTLT
jgi:hypothetical protein